MDESVRVESGLSATDPTRGVEAPKRVLGAFDATCVVVGAIIGVGIFFNPSKIAALTGSEGLALAAWGLAGLIAMCGALTFAELGRRNTSSGAQYEVLRDSYGPLPAFLFVFCNATAIQGGAIGIIAWVCAKNLGVAAGAVDPSGAQLLAVASALIVLLAGANVVGAKWGAGIQNITVVSKVATLLVITGLAAFAGGDGSRLAAAGQSADHGTRQLGAVAGVLAALVPAFFAFGGWQQALWISGEVKEPRKNLPRAIVVGVAVVTVVYLLANWAYLRLLGVEGVAGSTTLAADAVGSVAPGWGRRAVAGAVGVSAFGVLNSQLLSGPRLVYGMARDGRFFRVFGSLNGQFGTPVAAIGLLAVMGLGLLVRAGPEGIDRLLNGVMLIDAVFFILTGAALFVIRMRERRGVVGKEEAGFRTPGYPLTTLVFVLGFVGVAVGSFLSPDVRGAALIGVGWIAGAALVYAIWFRKK